jgi:hypothetical protein
MPPSNVFESASGLAKTGRPAGSARSVRTDETPPSWLSIFPGPMGLELRPPERSRIEDAANAPRRIAMVDSWNEGEPEAEDAVTVSKALDGRQGQSLEVDRNPDPPD